MRNAPAIRYNQDIQFWYNVHTFIFLITQLPTSCCSLFRELVSRTNP